MENKAVWKRFRFSNLPQKIVLELWQNVNSWPQVWMTPLTILEINWAQVPDLGKPKSWKLRIIANSHQKRSLKQIKRLI